jgi:hypothetical protein
MLVLCDQQRTYTYGTNYDETYVSKDLTIGKSDYHYGRCSV